MMNAFLHAMSEEDKGSGRGGFVEAEDTIKQIERAACGIARQRFAGDALEDTELRMTRWLVLAVLAVAATAAHGQAIVLSACGTGSVHGRAAAPADDGPCRLPVRVDDDYGGDGYGSPGDCAKAAHARP